MFTTPKKHNLSNNCNTSAMITNRYKLSNSTPNLTVHSSNNNSNKRTSTAVYENGLMYGSICNADSVSKLNRTLPTRPEKEINNAGSSGLNKQNHCEINIVHSEDLAMESTALLANTLSPDNISQSDQNNTTTTVHDELKQLEQDSDFLESSIYSELQFPPSMYDTDGVCVDDDIVSVRIASPVSLPQTPTNTNGRAQQIKRIKRKHRTKSKCSATAAALLANQRASPTYPPRYTAIYVGSSHNQPDNRLTANHGNGNAATNAFGQIVSAAAASPFLNAAPVAPNGTYIEQFQYHQQRPMITSMTTLGRHRHHRGANDRIGIVLHRNFERLFLKGSIATPLVNINEPLVREMHFINS
ncbi:hypothetical protein GQX74_012475 [Glossina fuscipes]|nr:hypothetical protein GQX74_012475 [Glossina fuscipes]